MEPLVCFLKSSHGLLHVIVLLLERYLGDSNCLELKPIKRLDDATVCRA